MSDPRLAAATPRASESFLAALGVQRRVIGALMMRELHTRYGRENIGYLWLFGEPMMLASVIALFHSGQHTAFGSDLKPLPLAVLGYTLFIMFRGIVNRSEGGLESNAPLLYHRMVTVFDIVTARALLEAAGTFIAYVVLTTILIFLGYAELPERPIFIFAAVGLMFWYSWAHSLVITGITHDNRTASRFVHPYSYFMVPLSAAFYQVGWLPQPYRDWLQWLPLPHIFELARYGQFRSADLRYFDGQYLIAACMVLTWVGLVLVRLVRERIHLS